MNESGDILSSNPCHDAEKTITRWEVGDDIRPVGSESLKKVILPFAYGLTVFLFVITRAVALFTWAQTEDSQHRKGQRERLNTTAWDVNACTRWNQLKNTALIMTIDGQRKSKDKRSERKWRLTTSSSDNSACVVTKRRTKKKCEQKRNERIEKNKSQRRQIVHSTHKMHTPQTQWLDAHGGSCCGKWEGWSSGVFGVFGVGGCSG